MHKIQLRYCFGKKCGFLTQNVFKTPKNKREIPKIMPYNPKNYA